MVPPNPATVFSVRPETPFKPRPTSFVSGCLMAVRFFIA